MKILSTWKEKLLASSSTSIFIRQWQQLSTRDQKALKSLTIFFIIALSYLCLWLPSEHRLEQAYSYYHQQKNLYEYVKKNSSQALQTSEESHMAMTSEHLQGKITKSAQSSNLEIEHIDSSDQNELQVEYTEVPTKKLLEWLAGLHSQGISVAQANLEKKHDGMVSARLTLKAKELSAY